MKIELIEAIQSFILNESQSIVMLRIAFVLISCNSLSTGSPNPFSGFKGIAINQMIRQIVFFGSLPKFNAVWINTKIGELVQNCPVSLLLFVISEMYRDQISLRRYRRIVSEEAIFGFFLDLFPNVLDIVRFNQIVSFGFTSLRSFNVIRAKLVVVPIVPVNNYRYIAVHYKRQLF